MEKRGPWLVAMGASGEAGLKDIVALLAALQLPLHAILFVVLHRPWEAISQLRDILQRASQHPVKIVDYGEKLEMGTVYIGEPAEHLTLFNKCFGKVVKDPYQLHRNRTIDLLFRSIAEQDHGRAIGVVLSGSSDDGSRGLAAIHDAGGLTMVIKPRLSSSLGLPQNAISYDGPIDLIGSPSEIAAAITLVVADESAQSRAQ